MIVHLVGMKEVLNETASLCLQVVNEQCHHLKFENRFLHVLTLSTIPFDLFQIIVCLSVSFFVILVLKAQSKSKIKTLAGRVNRPWEWMIGICCNLRCPLVSNRSDDLNSDIFVPLHCVNTRTQFRVKGLQVKLLHATD